MRGNSTDFRFIFVVFSVSILLLAGLPGQDEVVERMDVVNREVVVRVFDGGEPVVGLIRADFTLTENGKPVVITSCHEVRRSLAPELRHNETEEPALEKQRPRLFLFLLWWNEESKDWPKVWKYFLENIYRPGDQVIISGDQLAIQLKDPLEEKEKMAEFFQRIKGDLKKKQQYKSGLKRELESCVRNFDQDLKENERKKDAFKIPWEVLFNQFKSHYRGILEEYSRP